MFLLALRVTHKYLQPLLIQHFVGMTIIMRFLAFKTVFQYVTLICLTWALTSCGGSDDEPGGELTVPTARLSSFTIEAFNIDFDPSNFGPYVIEVPSDTETISFTAQAQAEFTLRYELGFAVSDPRFIAPSLDSPDRSTEFDAGVTTSIDLSDSQSENLLRISVIGDDSTVVSQYSFSVRRLSAQAALSQLNVFVGTTLQTLTPEFSTDEFNYALEIPATSCATTLTTRAPSNATRITVNDNVNAFGEAQTILTPVGETSVEVVVDSEDGSSSNTYTLVLTRPEPTELERQTISTLSALSIEGATFDFNCTTTLVGATVGGNTSGDGEAPFTVELNYTPDALDATVALIEQAVDTQTGALDTVSITALTNNETFDLPLALDRNLYQLRVTPQTGPPTFYNIVIDSVERNLTTVSTPEAFQQALTNAQPNEEIRVTQGVLSAVSTDSATDSAYFYSNQSGTQQQPIFISGELTGDGATLTGEGDDTRAVLQLDGDHWVIANLNITGAQTGIRLNGAENIVVENINVNETVMNGVIIENASNNNLIVQSTFNTQSTAIVVGSDSATWLPESGGQGTLAADNMNNIVRGNVFMRATDAPVIEVNEGAQNTIIEFNRFTLSAQTALPNAGTAMAVQGNDTVIRYNFVMQEGGENPNAIVRVTPAATEGLATEYGQNTHVYANQIKQVANQVFIQADNGLTVLTDSNTRVDGVALTFSGDAVNTSVFNTPFFRLQPSENNEVCITLNVETFIANTQACNDQDNQDWRIVLNAEGFLVIQNRIDLERALSLSSAINANQPFGVLASPENVGSRLQVWVPDFSLQNIRFLSRESIQFGFVTVTQNSDLVFAASSLDRFFNEPNFILEHD